MTIRTSADITGAGAKVQLSSVAGTLARRIWLCSTGGKSRFGDTNVSATQGVELPTDIQCTFSASDGDGTDTIDLEQAYVYVPMSSTVTVSWGI